MKTRLLLILFVACGIGFARSAEAQSTFGGAALGLVRGTVSGEGLGTLQGIALVIEGAGVSYEVITDENGAYQADVPPGIYMIYPKFLPDERGYGRFKRARFHVVPGGDTVINLSPFAGVDYCSGKGERFVDVQPARFGSKPRKLPPPKYDSYTVPQANGESLDLVVDFCKREKRGEVTVYDSVAVSYNDITLYADRISVRPRDLLVQLLAGKGMLIAGGHSREVTRLSLFVGKKTFIDLSPGFTESVKVNSKLQSKNISFSLVMERGGPATVFYEDRERGITLVSEGESLSFLTAESPNKMKLNGYGTIVSNNLQSTNASFTITIHASRAKQSHSSFSIEIPNARGYHESGVIPQRRVQIRREPTPPSRELADSVKNK